MSLMLMISLRKMFYVVTGRESLQNILDLGLTIYEKDDSVSPHGGTTEREHFTEILGSALTSSLQVKH